MRKIRIGIDVGGTFTDAVALDNDTYEIIAQNKLPTTHNAREGVASGVIKILNLLLEEIGYQPSDVVFIAHGTTQATNALLEGDVAKIGIIGMGSGIGVSKIKNDTRLGNVPLEDGKEINTEYEFIDTSSGDFTDRVNGIVDRFKDEGVEVAVISEAFSVDNPDNEKNVAGLVRERGLLATATHELSKLYGLKARTKTSVINGSILPKMVQTATMTGNAVKTAEIKAPLMIMRSDGGVMQIDEIKKRPILTVLSGPAAGVAGALMYEKISDGIFLEVGGTSTDISAIQNGKVITKYATIGGHKTYVNSLDIHTVGIAGGSMIRCTDKVIKDVGPRSAHIAGLEYACFADLKDLKDAHVTSVRIAADYTDNYLAIENSEGKKFAVTLTCIANILGLIDAEDYAKAQDDVVARITEILESYFNRSGKKVAEEIMAIAVSKVRPAVEEFIKQYNLSRNYLELNGGGGGASVVVPALAKSMGLKYKIADNAPIIATIGAALAMVRDSVERTIVNPTQNDILEIRKDAAQRAMESGASPGSIEVTIDIDATKNVVKATAVGTTELSAQKKAGKKLSDEEIQKIVDKSFDNFSDLSVSKVSENGIYSLFEVTYTTKPKLFFFKKKSRLLCLIDRNGVIKLNIENANYHILGKKDKSGLINCIESDTKFDEAGKTMPEIHLIVNAKVSDLSGLENIEQVTSLIDVELSELNENEDYILITRKR